MSGPFGEALSGQANPNNSVSGSTYSYVGSSKKLIETGFTLAVQQMGARVYLSTLGRFLSVDSVEGGVENSYVYPPDPINKFDLSGRAYTCSTYLVLCSRYFAITGNVARYIYFVFTARQIHVLQLIMRKYSANHEIRRKLDWRTNGCTFPGGIGNWMFAYRFANACARHDFGYRNNFRIFKGKNWKSEDYRQLVDTMFEDDMISACGWDPLCKWGARRMYQGVHLFGRGSWLGNFY
jgi:RHS repeat-associated protein